MEGASVDRAAIIERRIYHWLGEASREMQPRNGMRCAYRPSLYRASDSKYVGSENECRGFAKDIVDNTH